MSPVPVEVGINIKNAAANKAVENITRRNIDGLLKRSGYEASKS